MNDRGSAQGPGRAATIAVVGCTLLVALLVTWAALIGPGRVLDGEGPDVVRTSPTPTPTETVSEDVGPLPEPFDDVERGDFPLLVSLLAATLFGLVLLVLLAGVALGLRQLLRVRPRRRERALEVEFDVLEVPPARVAEAIVADAASQRAALLGGSPRNGIVQCWHRFETQAGGVGLPRRAWETSSEHALRVLDLAEADPHAVSQLAVLFREARFSDHEVTEESRDRAVRALEDVYASLTRRRVRP